jgi:ribose transport system permease protein
MGMLQRYGWVGGLIVLFCLLLIATKVIQPDFGATGLESLGRAAVPFAFATAGMAIVVIAGGIDLSIAAMMAVASVTAARLMVGAGDGETVLIVIFVLALGGLMGAINGLMIVLTRVPDIVVTLAMLFVWEGVALLILNAPSGAATQWLRDLILGSLTIPGLPDVQTYIPKSLVFVIICLAPFWYILNRTKLGLAIYAIGSDPVAAFRSGVNVGRTRVLAYMLAGVLAGLGGLSLTMSTGIGEPIPGPYLLASVAAVVLGGVAFPGGRGGLIGPVVAVLILRLVRLDLTLMSVDPNVTTIVEGTIMVVVVMLGGLLAMKGRRS